MFSNSFGIYGSYDGKELILDFFNFYMRVLFFDLVCSPIAWCIAFLSYRYFNEKVLIESGKHVSPHDLNEGLTRFPLFSALFYVTTLLNSMVYSIGASSILENLIFGTETLLSLLIAFLAIKLIVFLVSHLIVESIKYRKQKYKQKQLQKYE